MCKFFEGNVQKDSQTTVVAQLVAAPEDKHQTFPRPAFVRISSSTEAANLAANVPLPMGSESFAPARLKLGVLPRISDLGSRVSDLGSRTSNLGPRTSDLGPRISDLGPQTSDLGPRVSDLGSRVSDLVSDLGLQILNLGSRTSDLGSRISDLGSRASGLEAVNLGSGTSGLTRWNNGLEWQARM
eukprot:s3098_g5.t1